MTVTGPTRTVTSADLRPSASVAVTVQLPAPLAVTTPLRLTVATFSSLLVQNTRWPPDSSVTSSVVRVTLSLTLGSQRTFS